MEDKLSKSQHMKDCNELSLRKTSSLTGAGGLRPNLSIFSGGDFGSSQQEITIENNECISIFTW